MRGQILASLPAADLDRAKKWYSDVLGAEPVRSIGGDTNLEYDWGGCRFLVYQSDFAGTNEATAAGLLVDDFDDAAEELRSNGVTFMELDFGEGMKTEDGIMTAPDGMKGAWFTDSEGNIIALTKRID